MRILTTLLEADSGTAFVAGINVATHPNEVRARIGLSGQYAAVDEYLTGFENLDLFGRLYRLPRAKARVRARELLERFDLVEAGDRPVKTYSGGMRRRLDLAGALVAEPAVLFLDEPTTGLDPRGRADMWEVIREMVKSGTTLLLTTQYLEEADRLANEIVVIDHGQAIARGTADQLKSPDRRRAGRIGDRVASPISPPPGRPWLVLADGEVTVDQQNRSLTAPVSGGSGVLVEVLRRLDDRIGQGSRCRSSPPHPRRRVPDPHRPRSRRVIEPAKELKLKK